MINNLKFHHIGVATKSIEKELKIYEKLGYKPVSNIFIDETQKIKGLFIQAKGQPQLELLENLTPDGPLTTYLKKGIKFYHFAYAVNNIYEELDNIIKILGGMIIQQPISATYFDKICFLMLPNMTMIELVQEGVNI